MEKYKIEKDVPVPTRCRRGIYPFAKMEIGDSFFTEKGTSCATHFGKKYNKKFIVRKEKDGFRIWRIK